MKKFLRNFKRESVIMRFTKGERNYFIKIREKCKNNLDSILLNLY